MVFIGDPFGVNQLENLLRLAVVGGEDGLNLRGVGWLDLVGLAFGLSSQALSGHRGRETLELFFATASTHNTHHLAHDKEHDEDGEHCRPLLRPTAE